MLDLFVASVASLKDLSQFYRQINKKACASSETMESEPVHHVSAILCMCVTQLFLSILPSWHVSSRGH